MAKSKKRRTNKMSTQDLFNIKDIRNGYIETKDGRYIKILEFTPINFHLRSAREKRNIIYGFASWLKIAPIKMQFKVYTKGADVTKHIKKIEEMIEKESDEACKMLQEDYLKLLINTGMQRGLQRKFLLIFEYIPMRREDDEQYILTEINATAKTIENYLRLCGNDVVKHEDENVFLLETFYDIVCRDRDRLSLTDKISLLAADAEARGVDPNLMTIADMIAPKELEVHSSYLIADGTYYSFIYVPSKGYKTSVMGGWTSPFLNLGEGIDLDIFLEKKDKRQMRDRVSRSIRINRVKIKKTSTANEDHDNLMGALQSAYFIKDGLANGEDFYYMNTLITITANSEDEMHRKISHVKDMLVSRDMEGNFYRLNSLACFQSVLPLCHIDSKLFARSKRNVLTYGAASSYLFTAFEMSDEDGILMGVNKHNGSLCMLDLFNTKLYKNANVSILGTSGAGKTYLLNLMASRMRMHDIQVFILSPLKGHEFLRVCRGIGGEFIKISAGSPNCVNVLDIRKVDKSGEAEVDGEVYGASDSILARKIQKLETFFSMVIPDMNYEEKQLMDEALVTTYREKGITHDNDSLIDKVENGIEVYKKMPILGDLHEVLTRSNDTKRLATILNRYVNGSVQSFNGQTNVDLDNKYVVFDVSELSNDLLPIGMFVALDYIWDKAKEDRTKRKAIFMDEVWKLIGSGGNALTAQYVLEIFKIIRGYGGAAIAATQDINDFLSLDDGKYGKGIINACKTKIVLQLESDEAERVEDILDLSEYETMEISRYERGEGMIMANGNNIPVDVVSTDMEFELITTDRAALEQIIERRRGKNV